MTKNLVRTTTYFDTQLLIQAKKMAIDEGKSFYEFINERLKKVLEMDKFHFENIYKVASMKMKKKKITRRDAYE